jgi:hypothetical protein
MATDRDEQLRQQQELEEIRRSFAEMGARMGSMFEPAEPTSPSGRPRPAAAGAPGRRPRRRRPAGGGRPRWSCCSSPAPPSAGSCPRATVARTAAHQGATTATSRARWPRLQPPATVIKTKTSVPDTCVDAAELADEVISRLTRNIRDNRLAECSGLHHRQPGLP